MQKFAFNMTDQGTLMYPTSVGGFYLASEVDARIAELEAALRKATQCGNCGKNLSVGTCRVCDNDE